MFKTNETLEAQTQAALAVLREYKRGDCVPHEELARAIGMSPECGSDYYRVVRKARFRLRDEDGIWSRNENTEGFHLYTERETFVEEPRRRAKRARRQIGFTVKAAVAIAPESLSPNQRRLREAVIDAGQDMRRKLVIREEKAKQFMESFKGSPLRKLESAGVPVKQQQAI